MENLIRTIKKVWPKANWSISYREKKYVGYVTNGDIFGNLKFAEGYAETNSPESALELAFREALSKDYKRGLETPKEEKKKKRK